MSVIIDMKGKTYGSVRGLWQYDYGQTLRIQGLDLPTAVEIHFSLKEVGGESVTRVGITKDGVTDVVIPDSMLEAGNTTADYYIYAFIYLTDETSGETTHKIQIGVKSRPKPEAFDSPGDAELFRDAIAVINDAAGRAEESATKAEASEANAAKSEANTEECATNAAEYLAEIKELANQVETNKDTVTVLANEVSENAKKVESLSEDVATKTYVKELMGVIENGTY